MHGDVAVLPFSRSTPIACGGWNQIFCLFFFLFEKNVDALVWLPLRDGIRVSHSRQRRVHFWEKESRAWSDFIQPEK
jgi:hypothetical protein